VSFSVRTLIGKESVTVPSEQTRPIRTPSRHANPAASVLPFRQCFPRMHPIPTGRQKRSRRVPPQSDRRLLTAGKTVWMRLMRRGDRGSFGRSAPSQPPHSRAPAHQGRTPDPCARADCPPRPPVVYSRRGAQRIVLGEVWRLRQPAGPVVTGRT
jgi:hypothetical protein